MSASLQIFHDSTLVFSRGTPSISNVIPAMNIFHQQLSSNALDKRFCPAIRAAVHIAKKVINRYTAKTDEADAYVIAMSTDLFH